MSPRLIHQGMGEVAAELESGAGSGHLAGAVCSGEGHVETGASVQDESIPLGGSSCFCPLICDGGMQMGAA